MKKLLILPLLATLASVSPAAAQGWRDGHRGDDYRGQRQICSGARADRLQERIREAVRSHDLGRRQAAGLQQRVDDVDRQTRRDCRAGLSSMEARNLDHRYDRIERAVRRAGDHRRDWQ